MGWGTCRARSWHPSCPVGHSGSVLCQVEKGKAVELKEQLSERFEALRREHEETLQGACRPLGRAPGGPWDTHGGATTGTMAPQGSGRARCACPNAGDTRHVSPRRAPESARAGEAAAGRDAPQVPGGLTGTQGGIPTVLGSLQGPRRATETLPSPTQPWGYRGAPARAGNPDTPCPTSSPGCQETVEALRAQLKSFQERMKRVEESLLSRDYKKHIEV